MSRGASRVVKVVKVVLVMPLILGMLFSLRVTQVRVAQWYKNSYETTDAEVERHCSMALTKKLYCWCYEQLDRRDCPASGSASRD